MTELLTKVDLRKLQKAFDEVGKQKGAVRKQFGDQETAQFMALYVGHYLHGVLTRLGFGDKLEEFRKARMADTKEGISKISLELDMPIITEVALSLVMFGISVGRLYEPGEADECVVTPCTVTEAYVAIKEELEDEES